MVNSVSFISENELNNRSKEPSTKELTSVGNKFSGNRVKKIYEYVVVEYMMKPSTAGVSKLQLVIFLIKRFFIFFEEWKVYSLLDLILQKARTEESTL